MIKIIKYHQIDFQKYNVCIGNCFQNSDFAEKMFLDIVANFNWLILILNDYEAVMPVPYVHKFGIPFVVMPKLCLQLGIFSKEDHPKINRLFYDFLNQNFLVASYSFNPGNKFEIETSQKVSYILNKNKYEEIRNNYSKNRRRNVKITDELRAEISFVKDVNKKVETFIFRNLKGTKDKNESQRYFQIFTQLLNQNIGKAYILEFKNNIQSFVYNFIGKKNIYLSLFVNNSSKQNSNFPSLLIDHILIDFIEEKNFDFVGSELENVARFNERFGAVSYNYSVIKNSKTTLFKKLLTSYKIISNFAP